MGQAKIRGSKEDRITQAKAIRVPPKPGLYISKKEAKGMRLVVEDVTFSDDEDTDGFFMVSMIDEASFSGKGSIGDELDPEQWFALVEQYGLVHSDA